MLRRALPIVLAAFVIVPALAQSRTRGGTQIESPTTPQRAVQHRLERRARGGLRRRERQRGAAPDRDDEAVNTRGHGRSPCTRLQPSQGDN